jgi:thiamine pyrophosphate-dependent acetolactate synthase large subunit-like protein
LQELMMAKAYKLNVKVIVTVNNRLQLVEQVGASSKTTASCSK